MGYYNIHESIQNGTFTIPWHVVEFAILFILIFIMFLLILFMSVRVKEMDRELQRLHKLFFKDGQS